MRSYDASSIEVVQNVEHIRARPELYIVDRRAAGMAQTAKEIIDNSVDEYLGGHATKIDVVLNTKINQLMIQDDGRGIPVDVHAKTGMSALATVFLITGAGGKFTEGAYSVSAGLHGVGVTVVNALSSTLQVCSSRDGHYHTLEFQQGKLTKRFENGIPEAVRQKLPKSQHEHGTRVTFIPDTEIFGKKCRFDPDILREMLKNSAYLCAGLTFTLRVDDEDQETFHQDGGLKQFVEDHIATEKVDPLHPMVVFRNDAMEMALCWTDASDEKWFSYVNCSPTPLGGTHVTGLKRLLTNTLAPKATKQIENDDLRVGLRVALHCKIKQPQFKGQVKEALQNKETASEVYETLKDTIGRFLQQHAKVIDQIINRAVKLKNARDRFEKEKDSTKNVVTYGKGKRGILPADKFAEAPDCKSDERETFLCEGESAGGSCKQARDPYFQEVLGLKGKIPNAMQKAKSSVLENEEIKMIITAVGAGILDKCDPKKARIARLLLLMDADPDGQHITALMIAFLNRYMAPILDAGMVWAVHSPLFKGAWKDKNYFGDTIEAVVAQAPKGAKPTITRLKGHGESSVESLQFYAMHAATRKLIRITRDHATDTGLQELMSADTTVRRDLLGLEQDKA